MRREHATRRLVVGLAIAAGAVLAVGISAPAFARSSYQAEGSVGLGEGARAALIERLEAEPAIDWRGQDRETLSDGDLEFERQIADGWVQQGDGSGNIVGWVSSDALGSDDFFFEGRTPVFDEPGGGNVVGYAYNGVGFVTVEAIESGEFDLEAAFDAKYGDGAYAAEQAQIEGMRAAEVLLGG